MKPSAARLAAVASSTLRVPARKLSAVINHQAGAGRECSQSKPCAVLVPSTAVRAQVMTQSRPCLQTWATTTLCATEVAATTSAGAEAFSEGFWLLGQTGADRPHLPPVSGTVCGIKEAGITGVASGESMDNAAIQGMVDGLGTAVNGCSNLVDGSPHASVLAFVISVFVPVLIVKRKKLWTYVLMAAQAFRSANLLLVLQHSNYPSAALQTLTLASVSVTGMRNWWAGLSSQAKCTALLLGMTDTMGWAAAKRMAAAVLPRTLGCLVGQPVSPWMFAMDCIVGAVVTAVLGCVAEKVLGVKPPKGVFAEVLPQHALRLATHIPCLRDAVGARQR